MPSDPRLPKSFPVDLAFALHEPRRRAGALRDLAQALRVRGIGRADDDHRVDMRRDAFTAAWRLVVA